MNCACEAIYGGAEVWLWQLLEQGFDFLPVLIVDDHGNGLTVFVANNLFFDGQHCFGQFFLV